MSHILKRSVGALVALSILLTPTLVAAHDGEHHSEASPAQKPTQTGSLRPEKVAEAKRTLETKLEAQKQARQDKVQTTKAELSQKLDDKKKEICNKQKATINNIMKNMDGRRQSSFDRITKISDAIQTFVTKKELTIENYDTLVASVAAAKETAQASMTSQQSAPDLDCSGDKPRSDIADFKTKRLASIDAMQAYRDAVKALASAVKQAAKAAEEAES